MTVTNVRKDLEEMTLTINAEFDAPVERVWQLWDDPRQLERWWGPPTYPATVLHHDLREGGSVAYLMTGPEGDQPHGWWRVLAVEAPHRLEFTSGFADEHGVPNPDLPTMVMRVRLDPRPQGGTTMEVETRFGSPDDMAQIMAMGMEEGMSAALSQIDALVTAIAPS
jgi:uncharacterized protein YndB with AHSA1/START domain